MKVIFLKDVPRVGNKYEIKEVRDGYAVNFLFPKKMAQLATDSAIKSIQKRKKEIENEKKASEEVLQKSLEEIKDKSIEITAKADEKGNLFSGIHKKEIVKALSDSNINLKEDLIVLEKPIKQIGEFSIQVKMKSKKTSFKLKVKEQK